MIYLLYIYSLLYIIYIVYYYIYIRRYTVTTQESLSFKSSESSTELSLQGQVHNHCWEIQFRNHYMNNRL